MLAKSQTCAVTGLDGFVVQVEVDISAGLPAFNIVGLPDTAVQEARERVRAALRNSGCEFPMRRITVNLAPADLKKAGPAYDLPIAVGILLSSGQVDLPATPSLFLGELSLDGSLRHTNGVLPMVSVARDQGFSDVYVPTADVAEAALLDGIRVFPVPTLAALVSHLQGQVPIAPAPVGGMGDAVNNQRTNGANLAHIKGQEHAKRALEIAAAGFHNILLNGPPGSGKTMLARALPSILPRMTPEEAIDATKIYSISGALPADCPLVAQRPFRSPHYSISNAGLVGGGRSLRPGEITLSHRGVLFLDELPEFDRTALESLRQPLEDRVVTISRVTGSVTYPASFMLVAAQNPCPCGFYSHPRKECICSSSAVARYQKRISGPLLDRIDIFVEAPPVEYEKLVDEAEAEDSEVIRQRVEQAREAQAQRFEEADTVRFNSEISAAEMWKICRMSSEARNLLQAATTQLNLSARAFHRIIKVSRTIADLAQCEEITIGHLAEALQYRSRGVN